MRNIGQKVFNPFTIDLIDKVLDIIQNSADNLLGIGSILVNHEATLRWLQRYVAILTGPYLPTIFFFLKGITLTITSILNIYKCFKEDSQTAPAPYIKRFKNTFIAAGIALAYLTALVASAACSILIVSSFTQAWVVGAITLGMIILDTVLEIKDHFENKAEKKLLQYALLNLETELIQYGDQIENAERLCAEDPSNSDAFTKLQTLRINNMLIKLDYLEHSCALETLKRKSQNHKIYIATSLLGCLALITTTVTIICSMPVFVAIGLGAISLLLALTSTALSIYRAQQKQNIDIAGQKRLRAVGQAFNNKILLFFLNHEKKQFVSLKELKSSSESIRDILCDIEIACRSCLAPTVYSNTVQAIDKVHASLAKIDQQLAAHENPNQTPSLDSLLSLTEIGERLKIATATIDSIVECIHQYALPKDRYHFGDDLLPKGLDTSSSTLTQSLRTPSPAASRHTSPVKPAPASQSRSNFFGPAARPRFPINLPTAPTPSCSDQSLSY